MKIVLFVYDFPHKKSLKGMQIIKSHGFKEVFVVLSPKIELKFRQSQTRISVVEKEIIQPSSLAYQYGWKSLVANHNSDEALSFYRQIKPNYGIILGARILSKSVIDSFSEGIINFHPGVLPENRGLDNLKWAIYNKIPQGVTTHFIDENIDVGEQIYKELLEVNNEDTIFDVNSKLLDLQLIHLNKLISENFNFKNTKSLKSDYKSQKAVSDKIDKKIFSLFKKYKQEYFEIQNKYKEL